MKKKKSILKIVTILFLAILFTYFGFWLNSYIVGEPYSYSLFVTIKTLFLIIAILAFLISSYLIHKSAKSKALTNSIFFFFTTFSLFIVIEIAFSFIVFSTNVFTDMQNNIWIKRYFKPINSLGYRDTEPKTETGKKNILVIGDSFVAGHGIKHEEMFTFLMSEQLKKDYSVFNLGVCGSHTDREFDSLINYPVKPDIIILAYYHNDIESAMIKLNKTPKIENPKDKLNGLSRLFVNNSLFANFLFSNYAKKQISSQFMESPNNDILAYLDDSLWNYQVTALDKFKNYCSKKGIPLLIINFPTLNEGITIVNKIAGDKIKNYCLQNQIEFINIYEYVIDMPLKKRIANPMDNHPSAEVNKIVSDLLIEKIREINSLPSLHN